MLFVPAGNNCWTWSARSSPRPVVMASFDYPTYAKVSPVIQLSKLHLYYDSLFTVFPYIQCRCSNLNRLKKVLGQSHFHLSNPMIVASGGRDGTKLFDIRQNSFRYQNIILMVFELNFLINSLIFFIDASTSTQVSMALPARDSTAAVRGCCAGNRNSFPSSTTFQPNCTWACLEIERSNFWPSVALATSGSDSGIASLDKRTCRFSRIYRSQFVHLVVAGNPRTGPNCWPAPRRVEWSQEPNLFRLLQPPHRWDDSLCRRWANY